MILDAAAFPRCPLQRRNTGLRRGRNGLMFVPRIDLKAALDVMPEPHFDQQNGVFRGHMDEFQRQIGHETVRFMPAGPGEGEHVAKHGTVLPGLQQRQNLRVIRQPSVQTHPRQRHHVPPSGMTGRRPRYGKFWAQTLHFAIRTAPPPQACPDPSLRVPTDRCLPPLP